MQVSTIGLDLTDTVSQVHGIDANEKGSSQVLIPICVPMPRYYFHVRRGWATIIEHRSVDFSDFAEAAKEAARRARLLAEREATKVPRSSGAIVADNQFSTLLEVPPAPPVVWHPKSVGLLISTQYRYLVFESLRKRHAARARRQEVRGARPRRGAFALACLSQGMLGELRKHEAILQHDIAGFEGDPRWRPRWYAGRSELALLGAERQNLPRNGGARNAISSVGIRSARAVAAPEPIGAPQRRPRLGC